MEISTFLLEDFFKAGNIYYFKNYWLSFVFALISLMFFVYIFMKMRGWFSLSVEERVAKQVKASEKKERDFQKWKIRAKKWKISFPGENFETYKEYVEKVVKKAEMENEEAKSSFPIISSFMIFFMTIWFVISIGNIVKNEPLLIQIDNENNAIISYHYGRDRKLKKSDVNLIESKREVIRNSRNYTSEYCEVKVKLKNSDFTIPEEVLVFKLRDLSLPGCKREDIY